LFLFKHTQILPLIFIFFKLQVHFFKSFLSIKKLWEKKEKGEGRRRRESNIIFLKYFDKQT